jgi:hypothetical protein
VASDSNTVKGKPYRLEIDPPGLNSGIQPVQGVAHREGSEGSSHQQAEKWEIFGKIREGTEGSSHQQAEKWVIFGKIREGSEDFFHQKAEKWEMFVKIR